MVTELQEKGVWAPHTPAKSIPARQGLVFVDQKWKNNVGGSFPLKTSKDSTDFNAMAFTDSIDAAQASEEANGNSQIHASSTKSENGNAKERHEDYVNLIKQPKKKPRKKKYWPKVLVELKAKKTPKPSTPKPRIPKTSKGCSPQKRKDAGKDILHASNKPSEDVGIDGQAISASYVPKSARPALSLHLQNQERDYGKDARIIVHKYQRRKRKMDKSSSDTKTIEQLKEGQSEKWIQSTHVSMTKREVANDPRAMDETDSCNGNSLKVYKRTFWVNRCLSNSRKLGPVFPRMWKKRRMRRRKATILLNFIAAEDGMGRQNKTMHAPLQAIIAAEDSQKIVKKARTKRRRATKGGFGNWRSISSAKDEQRLVDIRNFSSRTTKRRLALQFNNEDFTVGVNNSSMICFSAVASMPKKKRSNKSIRRLDLDSLALIPRCNPLPSAPLPQSLDSGVWNHDLFAGNEDIVTKWLHEMAFLDIAVLDHHEVKGCPGDVFSTPERLQDLRLVDVVQRLERLHISEASGQGKVGEHREMVVYESKKRKPPPPKVDIDQETMRVWNLLMANRGDDVEEEKNKNKEKWWEEQRKVFCGRVDSFIARMHLVQGDRRFSPWKGSVVDSVVGVFLTQNVSDHLSSSAFMSLAAKYPLRSKIGYKSCNEDGEIVCSQESVGSTMKAVIQNELCQLDFIDSFSDEDPPSISKHSTIERSSVFSEIIILQESSGSENGGLLGNGSVVDSNISRRLENGKQGSGSNSLLDVDGIPGSVCSLSSQKQNSYIPLTPSVSEVESGEILADFRNTMMKDVGGINQNLGCMESSGNEYVVQEKAAPGVQEATVELCASSSKCQVLPEYSSQAEFNQAKGQQYGKNHQGGSGVILQSKAPSRKNESKVEEKQANTIDWDDLRKTYISGRTMATTSDTMDSLDWEEVRQATVDEVADAIKGRGQHRVLAGRIKDFLDRVVRDHGSINLEWLRDVPPDKAKEYLLSFKGLGLKSVECVRLLTLRHHAFPVDTNVGRVAVRLGWVPLQPLPESLQIHLLEQYPVLDSIQVYLWPRLCTLDQRTLYELHYQMITFGKVFCRKRKPNCNACPMRGECRHFASAFASARLALPGPQEKSMVSSMVPYADVQNSGLIITPATKSPPEATFSESSYQSKNCEPIIEHPSSPEPESTENLEKDIEDFYDEDDDEDYIPFIQLNAKEFKENLQEFVNANKTLEGCDMSKALVALTPEAASIPVPKLKDVSRLRTEHHVYELPDSHLILAGFEKREPDDPSPYLLAILTSGGTAISSKLPRKPCESSPESHLCNEDTCSSCDNFQDQNSQTVSGTILIPCRTATRGSFPLNGTYFQVNEVFADDETSQHPLNVPRAWIWNLRRRTLYCGAEAGRIFTGLSTAEIQSCFWRGFICVRAFNRKTRAPAHLPERFHVSTIPRGKRKFAHVTTIPRGKRKITHDE